jgi:hypothetical protein
MALLRPRSNRLRDIFLYVMIGLLLVAVVSLYAIYQAKSGGPPGLPLKWLGFGGMTLIVFGYAIRYYKFLWASGRFWTLLSSFWVVHSLVAIGILVRVRAIPLAVYAVLTLIEYAILRAYIDRFVPGQD